MKICVSASGNSIESSMDPRFGRSAYFIIADADTMESEIIENSAAASGGGAGINSGQLMVDRGVEVVITGNVGPNAMNVLKAANIDIYHGESVPVKENIDEFKKGLLKKITSTVPSHFGMGVQGGQK
ncbi:MAG: dinitrogenase iron-molybdenum cofactor biosynthesis protein [Desulfitibacter sp. BRH_c19]|nr:MAG: dinitrogenase iron-molybdenum cofactor biosynthesis protein [Desulfitibacter sp. BRH_c19]